MSVAHEQAGPWSHRGPWTADDVLALPDDDIRYEVVDGDLIVNPPPAPRHQRASSRLSRLLEDAAVRTETFEAVGISMPRGQLLIPDVVVVAGQLADDMAPLVPSGDVLLAVEVVSPGSLVRDRVEKPALYAEAGIPHYWRIELGKVRGSTERPPVVFAYRLGSDGEYAQVATGGAGRTLRLAEPFAVEFDPASLVEGK